MKTTKPMNWTKLTVSLGMLVIAAGAFMAGRISSPDGPKDAAVVEDSGAGNPIGVVGSGETFKSQRAQREAERGGRGESVRQGNATDRLESIVRNEDPLARARAWLAFIDGLQVDDFESAVDEFRELGLTEERMGEYAQLLSAWAKVDPLAALAYARQNTRSSFATQTILSAWAGVDPDGALRWAESEHKDEGANPYLAGIIRGMAAADPERAYQLLTGMPRSVERGEALDAVLPHIIAKGAAATHEWIASLTDDSLRNGAIQRSASALARVDPEGTAAWLLASSEEVKRRSLDNVYREWANQDLAKATQSLESLPAGADRSNALRGLVYGSARVDPQAAAALLDRYPEDVTDRTVNGLAWHSMRSNPEFAVNQLARISDESSRNRMYEMMVGMWMRRDAEAARAWMQTANLPTDLRERLERR